MTTHQRTKYITQVKVACTGLALFLSANAQAQLNSLATTNEHRLGVSLIGYQYKEPGVMTLKAQKIGFDYAGTYSIASQWPNVDRRWFARTEISYAVGDADYSSPISGTVDNTENWYYEIRAMAGRDVDMGNYVLAPYAGLGFRYLYHDLRGISSTGARGYRRENRSESLFVGLTHKTQFSDQAQLHSTIEYMHLLKGTQKARLTDTAGTDPDITLDQDSGFGLRLSSMWRFDTWSIGPTLTYWNIKKSNTVRAGGSDWVEPKNTTTEIGLKAAYHF